MLTDRDAYMGAYTTGLALSEIPVKQSMSKNLISVRPEEPIDEAALTMRDHQVRRVPVVDAAGRLVGVLSQNDLIFEAAREREVRRKELNPMNVTAVLARIGHTRAGQLAPRVSAASDAA
jgi:CBS domain-containing protein